MMVEKFNQFLSPRGLDGGSGVGWLVSVGESPTSSYCVLRKELIAALWYRDLISNQNPGEQHMVPHQMISTSRLIRASRAMLSTEYSAAKT